MDKYFKEIVNKINNHIKNHKTDFILKLKVNTEVLHTYDITFSVDYYMRIRYTYTVDMSDNSIKSAVLYTFYGYSRRQKEINITELDLARELFENIMLQLFQKDNEIIFSNIKNFENIISDNKLYKKDKFKLKIKSLYMLKADIEHPYHTTLGIVDSDSCPYV